MINKIIETMLTKHILTAIVVGIITAGPLDAQQQVSPQQLYERAKKNYPLVKQKDLIEKASSYSVENLTKAYLPQVSFFAQASYQSQVTEIPVHLPNVNIPTISKDQYKAYGEINQLIYDGGNIRNQVESERLRSATETQQLEVDLYTLRDRINQLYFGVLLLQEQLKQNELLTGDLNRNLATVEAAIANGSALRSNADLLKAELLKADQQSTEFEITRKTYLQVLSMLTGEVLAENTVFIQPATQPETTTIKRPELKLFQSRLALNAVQNRVIDSRLKPKISLFLQTGFGRPALNFLSNSFDPFYLGGIRMSWAITGFYTAKKERELIIISKSKTEIQQETFLLNTSIALKQSSAEIEKLKNLLTKDDSIIQLRESIKKAAEAQMKNAVITTTEFLRELNAEDMAKQTKIIHNIQLLMAQYNFQYTAGN